MGLGAASRRVTAQDVADRAGVAQSSVSRALSRHPTVSPRLRQRVEDAAAALGYQPHPGAQSMRGVSTATVGFAVSDISNPLVALIARTCEQELRASGFSMIVVNSDGDPASESRGLSVLRSRRVDGVIACLETDVAATTQRALAAFSTPVVLLDRDVGGLSAGAVLCDHFSGTYAATTDLLRHGHRKIGLLADTTHGRAYRERLLGVKIAHRDTGRTFNEELLLGSMDSPDATLQQVLRLASSSQPPTAFMTGGIASTAEALKALRQLGLVPGVDVALIALDEWPLFDIVAPTLSSVCRDPVEIGTSGTRILKDMLNGGEPTAVSLPTTYRPRQSLTTVSPFEGASTG